MINAPEDATQALPEASFTGQPARVFSTNKAKSWAEGYFTFESPRQSNSNRGELENSSTDAPNRSQHLLSSPSEKQTRGEAIMAALTGDSGILGKSKNTPKRGLSSWFSTAPSTSSSSDIQSIPRSCTTDVHQSKMGAPTSLSSPNTLLSSSDPIDDDLLNVNINDALFPESSRPNSQDPYSPTAFRDLLTNAEELLTRLQTAYAQRTHALREMSSSRDSLAEELDEANTRADSLRSQLEMMAQKGTLQDQRIADLERELQEARSCQLALASTPKQNLLPNSSSTELSCTSHPHIGMHANSSSFTLNEDPCQGSDTGPQSWRSSSASTQLSMDIDAGDSDAESGAADSVFSRPRSPALTMRSTTTSITSEEAPPITPRFLPFTLSAKQGARARSFWSGPKSYIARDVELGCTNCRGKNANLAWDAVELLRAENTGLKEKITSLQEGVDGALAAIMCFP
ncbi:hypothetical protein K3495_g11835 [Podosphaera aphanis]|nr:hypothetical protein K3495_g11835 [Podosphaera aphanis]